MAISTWVGFNSLNHLKTVFHVSSKPASYFQLPLLLLFILALFSSGNTAHAKVGATTPFTCFEAETGTLGNGATTRALTTPPTNEYSSPELEASGHAFVQLTGDGQFVEWTNTTSQPVTFINLRYCIPDAPTGGGIDATLDLYVDGTFRQTLNLTSKQTWLYETNSTYGGNDQNPANGYPRVFFDDTHTFIIGAAIAPGSSIRLQKNPGNNASFYYIDVIDLENPPAPLTQPANSLSITSYGAVANNTNFDSTSAIQNCLNAAQSQGRSVWIPPGTYYLKGKPGLTATGVTIEGAGMWYSTIYRDVPLPNDSPLGAVFTTTSCTMRNFAVDANATSRAVVDGCGGSMDTTGNYWLAENIWTQHTMSGFWASGIHGTVRNCRLISIWADGCNLNNVSAGAFVGNYLTASNNFVRGTGDDAMAINSVNYNINSSTYTYYIPMTNTTFINNTTIGAWGGKGLAIYGGSGHLVKDNYTSDTARYTGLGVMKFGVNGSDLLSATVIGNVVVRSGGNGYLQQQQALMVGNGSDGQGVGTVANAYCASNTIIDSLYPAIGLSSCTNIVLQYNTIITPGMDAIVVGPPNLGAGVTGSALIYSNSVTGLKPGYSVLTNAAISYAAVIPIPAANFNTMSGISVEPCSEGGQNIGEIQSGDWAQYPNINLSGDDTFVARVASGSLGGTIEIHLDSPTGDLIGTCAVPFTGGWQNYTNVYATINGVSGTHDIYLAFTGGAGKLFNIQHFGLFGSSPLPSHQLAVGSIYALKSAANGKYVRADSNGGVLIAGSTSISETEQFEVVDAGSGNIALQNVVSNTFVCAESNGNSPLIANRTAVGLWETFTELGTDNGNIALRAMNNGKYVSLVSGSDTLLANSASIGLTQSFSLELVSGIPPSTPNGLRISPGNASAVLNWAVSSGASTYNIKRSTTNGGPHTIVESNVVNAIYTDTGLSNGTTYYYAVSAVNPAGESSNSTAVSVMAGSLDRLGWVATASPTSSTDVPSRALDGNINTRWGTGTPQVNGQWLQIDMAGINTINKIVLDAGSSSSDYPRGYRVNLSMDGINWGNPVATGAGSSAITTITFPAQTSRFIRITQTGSVSGLWWSVHELNVFGATGTTPTAPTGLTGTAGDGQATLSWNPSANTTGYNVKYATATNGTYTLLSTNSAPLEFTASSLANGTAYYFVVSAVNSAGESANSAPIRLQPVSASPTQLNFGILGNQLQLAWPQDHTGWRLQVQTNSPGVGLGTNWVTLPDSTFTNQMLLPIAPTQGSIFFRLISPSN